MTTKTRYPMPGQLMSVGSHRLHAQVMGTGGPTLVLESGQAGFSMDWMFVQAELAQFARVVAYDRAGLGWSETGPEPRTPDQIVRELHALLEALQLPKPYVFVAHSLGGRYARLYAHHYPQDVAALVLVDPDTELYGEFLGTEKYQLFVSKRGSSYRLLDRLARLGLLRLFGKSLLGMFLPELRHAPGTVKQQYIDVATRPGAMRTTVAEYELAVAADAQLKAAGLPQNIPVRVLVHGAAWPYPDYEQAWQDALAALAAQSPLAETVPVKDSGHAIHLAQPKQVIEQVREVVEPMRV